MGYTMLFGTPVLPEVGVTLQIIGTLSTTSDESGGVETKGGEVGTQSNVQNERTVTSGAGADFP